MSIPIGSPYWLAFSAASFAALSAALSFSFLVFFAVLSFAFSVAVFAFFLASTVCGSSNEQASSATTNRRNRH